MFLPAKRCLIRFITQFTLHWWLYEKFRLYRSVIDLLWREEIAENRKAILREIERSRVTGGSALGNVFSWEKTNENKT